MSRTMLTMSVRMILACSCTYSRATSEEFSTIVRMRPEKLPSMARENVVVAATASKRAGSAATTENSPTMRVWSLAPGVRSAQARRSPIICQAMTAIIARMSSTLMASAVHTTSLRGAIVVRPVRMR